MIYFGLDLDERLFARPNTEEGQHYLGTKGLLEFAEAHLGLEGNSGRNEHIRTEQYRQTLLKYMKTHPNGVNPFFKASFEADELACAEALLQRRDELLCAGWDFKLSPRLPDRLRTLAEIEKETKKLAFGIADRWHAVLKQLKINDLPIEDIQIMEPLEYLQPQLRRFFKALKRKKVNLIENAKKQIVSKKANGTVDLFANPSDFEVFKQFIQNQEAKQVQKGFKNDGTLRILHAPRDTDAAAYLAKFLYKNSHYKPVLLIPDGQRVLDDALIQEGLPSLGMPSSSNARPTLQLLKLVTAFLWRPIDPYKILEFVTLAHKPLADDLANIIAGLIAKRPGINGDAWYFEVNRYFEDLKERAEADTSIQYQEIRAQYDFWFERLRFDVEKSVPKEQPIDVFQYLHQWASREFEKMNGKNASLLVLSEQARRIEEFLRELPPTEQFIGALELERIIRTIYEPAPVQPSEEEIGTYAYVNSGGALLNAPEQLIWWHFVETEPAHFFSKWYKHETVFLKNLNVELQTPQEENALLIWQREQPILKTNKSLLFVAPEKLNGEAVKEHPLFSHFRACFSNWKEVILNIESTESLVLPTFELPIYLNVAYQPLEKPRPFIRLNEKSLEQRDAETMTSLDSLLYYPYQWVFRHKAKLTKSPILSVTTDKTLMGNLSHRFFELVLKEDFIHWEKNNVNDWVDKNSRRLLAREGAVLMMYGREPERIQFLRQLKHAIWSLIEMIRKNGWTVKGTEMDLKGTFFKMPIHGKADVVLERGAETAILDLKWSGHGRHESKLKNKEDLQLVTYSKLLNDDDGWAHTAYFIMENARPIARNTLAFSELSPVMPNENYTEVHQDIWDRMTTTYQWRVAQIEKGNIEVRTTHTMPDLEQFYGAELNNCLEMRTKDAPYDDYGVLIGLIR
jgi:ATP-dependent helicase/nuclease subunit B